MAVYDTFRKIVMFVNNLDSIYHIICTQHYVDISDML